MSKEVKTIMYKACSRNLCQQWLAAELMLTVLKRGNKPAPERPDVYYTLSRQERQLIHEIECSGGNVTQFAWDDYWISCGPSKFGRSLVSSETVISLIKKGVLVLRQTNSPTRANFELDSFLTTWTERYWLSWIK